jgi:hypothetical protein
LRVCFFSPLFPLLSLSLHPHAFEPLASSKQYIKIHFVPHRKHYVSATKPNRLMLFRETVAVYCENHTEDTDTLCGQVKAVLYKGARCCRAMWRLSLE